MNNIKPLYLIAVLFLILIEKNISQEVIISVNRASCISCKSLLITESINKSKLLLPDYKVNLLITNINKKQKIYLEKEILSLFKDVNTIYDIDNQYKTKYNLKESIEYLVVNANQLHRFIDVDKFYDSIPKIPKLTQKQQNVNLNINIKKTLDSILLDESFDYVELQSPYLFKNNLYFYDKVLMNIGIVNLKDNKRKLNLSLSDFISKNIPTIDTNEFNKYFGITTNKIRFYSFFQKDNNTNLFFVYEVLKDKKEIIIRGNVINVPDYEYYESEVSQDSIINTQIFELPDRYTLRGRKQITYQNGSYILNVFDRNYHHTKHDLVKDTTNIIVSINKNKVESLLTYNNAEVISKSQYGLIFFQDIYQTEDNINIVGLENNLFLQYKDSKLTTFLNNKEGILREIIDSANSSDKNIYFSGIPYKIKNKIYFLDYTNFKNYHIFLFKDNNNSSDSEKKYIFQIYKNDELINEKKINIDNNIEGIAYLLSNTNSLYLVFTSEEYLYYMELDVE